MEDNMKNVIMMVFILLLTGTMSAQSWNVAGDFNAWNNAGNPMYDDGTNGDPVAGDGIYTAIINIPTVGRYEWKVSEYGSWNSSYPNSNAFSFTTSANQDVMFTFDTNTYTDDWMPATNIVNADDQASPTNDLVAVGDHNGWNNAGTEVMHDDGLNGDLQAGDGVYTWKQTIATPGSYGWKATLSGSWDAWGSDGRGIGAANVDYTTTMTDQIVFFQLNVLNGRIIVSDVALPVELVSFSADVINYNVNLNWSTATEINNKGFIVERSSNNNIFSKIGFVDGKGTSSNNVSYSYTDNNCNEGTYYYRLNQIDFNGTSTLSKVVRVEVGAPAAFELSQNYPNPFNPSTTIHYSIPEDAQVIIQIYDITGRIVKTLSNTRQSAGDYNVRWEGDNSSGSEVSAGMYFLKLNAGSYSNTIKMMLLK
jgi:hypothetical protein